VKFELILAALKSVADMVRGIFGWLATKEKDKKDAINKTTSGIGKGKPFILLVLLFVAGCGYVYTISTPMTFDPNDFQYVKAGKRLTVPKDGYYFSNEAMEKYIRSKIAEYEIRKRGFFHKSGDRD